MDATTYGAVPLPRATGEDARFTTRAKVLTSVLTVGLLVGAGAAVRARGVSDVVNGVVPSLGQTQSGEESLRQVIVEAIDHLACTDTCRSRHDSLAARVENDDASLVCADFNKYATEDSCVQSCGCEDKTVISTIVEYLCGENAPSDPKAVFETTFYESMTDKVLKLCPPSQ